MTKIQLRHDTAANFASVNPVLLAGEVGVETDTNKIKIGDGTTAYNSLEYFGGDIDLSNYYNKTETDELLDEKQDKLSPNPPLTITEYTKNNLEGFVYTSDNTGLLTAGVSDSTKAYLTRWESGQTSTFAIESYANGTFTDSQNTNNIWSGGYIDIPYTFGQVVGGGKSSYSLGWENCNIIFGKFVDNRFVPITFPLYIGSSGCYIQVSDSDTFSYSLGTNRCSMYQTNVPVYGGSSYGTQASISTSLESERAYGSLCQLVDTGSMIKANVGYGSTFASYNGGNLAPSSYSRLKEITTARIIGLSNKGGSSSYPLIIDGLGLYNSEGEITATTFVTANALGENLFDISGVTKQTYLDLHIGTGLSVDGNGNLINTNPTAPSVMTGATSSTEGTSGLVPAPQAGDDTKFLCGDGTYKTAGSSATVDQTYDATSSNAQSGVAIAGAGFLNDNSSASTSLYIGQNSTSTREYATVIGRDISNTVNSSTCVGYATQGIGEGSVAMGYRANSQGDYSIAIGSTATTVFTQGLAIGYQALTSASHAIQLGTGTNSTQGTFQVGNYQLLDSSGKIPDARLNSTVLLTSTGVSSTSIRTIAKLTEAEYQALATKDTNTFYVIVAASS